MFYQYRVSPVQIQMSLGLLTLILPNINASSPHCSHHFSKRGSLKTQTKVTESVHRATQLSIRLVL